MKTFEIIGYIQQKPIELIMLQEFFAKHDFSPKKILEIGTLYGGTTLLWAKMVQVNDGIVYGIDRVFHQNNIYKGTEWEKYVVEIMGDSHSIEIKNKVREQVSNVDLLFIDGDHTFKGVKEDFKTYSPLVKEGGWIALHDILDTEYNRSGKGGVIIEVADLWKELKLKYEHYEIVDPVSQENMGIGVIRC
jgi:cephalosporin hydroxylase